MEYDITFGGLDRLELVGVNLEGVNVVLDGKPPAGAVFEVFLQFSNSS